MEIIKARLCNFALLLNCMCSTLNDVLINLSKSDVKITTELQQILAKTGQDLYRKLSSLSQYFMTVRRQNVNYSKILIKKRRKLKGKQ